MTKSFLTCVFKIHKPTAWRREVMDYALREYTEAYQRVLDRAALKADVIAEEGLFRDAYTAKSIGALLDARDVALHSSVKDSLIQDVAGNLASYFALKQADFKASWPTSRNFQQDVIDGALDDFALVGIDDYDAKRDELLRCSNLSYMPISFCRHELKRNFALLRHSGKNQLWALLYLLPNKHPLGRSLAVTGLYHVTTGELLEYRGKCAIAVPLEVGRNGWQQTKFLDAAATGDAHVKTAYLVKDHDRNEYFLHVAFEFPVEPQYKPDAYLGVDRGILFSAAYALVDKTGAVIEMGHYDDGLRDLQHQYGRRRMKRAMDGQIISKVDYKTQAYDAILHSLANTLLEKAYRERAEIVLEKLDIQVKGGLVISRFKKFQRFIEYKARQRGVPTREVFAAYSSVICHVCGEDMARADRLVECSACSYDGHSDDNAAVNIARRALYRKADWPGGYRQFHRSFIANERTFQIE